MVFVYCFQPVWRALQELALRFLHRLQQTLSLWDFFPDGRRVALAGGLLCGREPRRSRIDSSLQFTKPSAERH